MTSNPPEASIMPPAPPDRDSGGQMTFFEHLIELRKRIIHSLIAVGSLDRTSLLKF